MHRHRGVSGVALATLGGLIAALPFIVGQGCGVDTVVIPVTGSLPGSTGGGTGTTPPTFTFTAPLGAVQAELGDDVVTTWTDSGSKNAVIAILLDPDGNPNNGNEIAINTNILVSDTANSLTIATGNFNLVPGTYTILARVSDGVNPELIVAAPGQVTLFAPGTVPGNMSPSIVVSQPRGNLSISQGSQFTINYCGNDPDGGPGGIVTDVIIMLDSDDNPLDDLYSGLDLTSAAAATTIANICSGALPAMVNGAVVLGCAKDDKCTNPNPGTAFAVTVDTSKIPQPADGRPYHVRVDMWDHTNPPVHAYAPGTVSVTALATGTVDLGDIGRRLAGAKFLGFDTGAQAGSTGTTLGDFDGDGAADFILVARYGRPYERGNVGSAYLVYGTKGQRFGSEINLNSFGTGYRGCEFAMGYAGSSYYYYYYSGQQAIAPPATDGIVSIATIEDQDGDGKPEIMFGLPYVERVYDYLDDDPCDKKDLCYGDGAPNPLSLEGNPDYLSDFDYRSGYVTINNVQYLCSNTADLSAVPLNQGMIVYVNSNNALVNTVLDISMAGQGGAKGARLRGGQYLSPFSWDANNRFGQTLGSMHSMSNVSTNPIGNGHSDFLFSVPSANSKHGLVDLTWGQDLGSFCAQPVQSIPDVRKIGDCSRSFWYPAGLSILGANAGDELGYANRAGDFNGDGRQDILCGSPGAKYGIADQAGIVYIIFGRLDFGSIDLSKTTVDPSDPTKQYVPRMEIHGTNAGDRFGENQILMGDVNGDGFADIAIASQTADGPGGIDSGYVGIVFGAIKATGEYSFTVNQIATGQLPGVAFYGTQTAGHAGAVIADVGDFNHDGFDDLLISAPGEYRMVGGQNRHGVAYLIFGGLHLYNKVYNLNQVGTSALPGMVFISPYAAGTADEATIDFVGAAGDVDGDGFADLLIGVSMADFVNPLDPTQRRIDAGEGYLIYGNNSGSNVVR